MVPMEHIITDNRFSLSNIQQKAKKFLSFCAVFGLLIFLLIHPSESLECAKAGMTLWLNTLIPTLLPFIILTGTLTHINSIQKLLAPLESFFRIVLGVSIWGGYIFVLGILCGYPLGAKLASDLYTSRKISKKEALYLTTFCNNASPAFIITYLNKLCLKNAIPVSLIFISIFSANLICMLFFRFAVYKNSIYSFTVSAPLKKEHLIQLHRKAFWMFLLWMVLKRSPGLEVIFFSFLSWPDVSDIIIRFQHFISICYWDLPKLLPVFLLSHLQNCRL